MTFYRQVGEVPGKRHTVLRDAGGALRYEELMGEEGFSSDSALLYHRGVPSAIVDLGTLAWSGYYPAAQPWSAKAAPGTPTPDPA